MSLFVKLYRDVPNPLGFPSDYPSDATESEVALGHPWIEMSKEDYSALIEKNRSIARAIIDQAKAAEDQSVNAKTSSLESTFDQLQSIANKFEGAGRLEPEDQLALSIHIMKSILALRDPLIEIQKRSK